MQALVVQNSQKSFRSLEQPETKFMLTIYQLFSVKENCFLVPAY